MNESEKIKEQILTNIKTYLIADLTETQINSVIIILSRELKDVVITNQKDLPSIDVVDNKKICNNYLATKKIEGLSDNSIRAYKFSINKMLTYFNYDIKTITTNHLRVFFAEYGKTVSLVTVDNIRRNLNSFFQWLEDEDYIDKNPCKKLKRIKTPKTIKTPLTTVEVERIRDTCSRESNSRDIALIDLLLSTGIRCEEVTKIKLSDCNFDEKTIQIHGKGAKDRIVYMSERCRMHLLDHLKCRKFESEYLFCNSSHNHLTTGGLSHIMREIGDKAGVEKCQIHRFRKYFASDLAEKGCDITYVQQLLGHAKLDTTKKHYVTIKQNNIHNEFDRLVA